MQITNSADYQLVGLGSCALRKHRSVSLTAAGLADLCLVAPRRPRPRLGRTWAWGLGHADRRVAGVRKTVSPM
jgi:hypothetical protein